MLDDTVLYNLKSIEKKIWQTSKYYLAIYVYQDIVWPFMFSGQLGFEIHFHEENRAGNRLFIRRPKLQIVQVWH